MRNGLWLQKGIGLAVGVVLYLSAGSSVFAAGEIQEGLYKYYSYSEITGLEYYENFVRNGIFFEYYPSGEIKRMAWYQNGQPHGIAKVYSEDGKLLHAVVYRNGKIMKSYTVNDAGRLTVE